MVTFTPFTTTDEQRANLERLAAVLADPKKRKVAAPDVGFDMNDFFIEANDDDPECGTVACACGWGPFAAVPPLESELYWLNGRQHIHWIRYGHRAFGADNADAMRWMFGASWAYYDNTPEGAAKRILIALKHGIPIGSRGQFVYRYDELLA